MERVSFLRGRGRAGLEEERAREHNGCYFWSVHCVPSTHQSSWTEIPGQLIQQPLGVGTIPTSQRRKHRHREMSLHKVLWVASGGVRIQTRHFGP